VSLTAKDVEEIMKLLEASSFIRIKGSFFPAPKVPTPRIKKEALSFPGSPLR